MAFDFTFEPPEVASVAAAAATSEPAASANPFSLEGLAGVLQDPLPTDGGGFKLPEEAANAITTGDVAPAAAKEKKDKGASKKKGTQVGPVTESDVNQALDQVLAQGDIPELQLGSRVAVVDKVPGAEPSANGSHSPAPADLGPVSKQLERVQEQIRTYDEAVRQYFSNLDKTLVEKLKGGVPQAGIEAAVNAATKPLHDKIGGLQAAMVQLTQVVGGLSGSINSIQSSVNALRAGRPAPATPEPVLIPDALKDQVLLNLPDVPAPIEALADQFCTFLEQKKGLKLEFSRGDLVQFIRESGAADEEGDVSKGTYVANLRAKGDMAAVQAYSRKVMGRLTGQ